MNHGNLVWSFYQKLLKGDWDSLKLPDWFIEFHEVFVSLQLPLKQVKRYIINHDCGKHLCRVEENGREHYPDHANVSADYWAKHSDDKLIEKLIRNDMFFHTCTAEELNNAGLNKQELATLLLASIAEIHANAELFGGINSQSFKIKYKQLDRRGKSFVKSYIDNPYKGYSYCFVRSDISKAQQAVQLSHVCIELQRKFEPARHPSIVAISINPKKINKVIQECIDNEIDFVIFRDNIHENKITGIATEPIFSDQRKVFIRYTLL